MAIDKPEPRYPDAPPTSHPGRKPDEETDEARIYRGVTFASDDYVPWIVGRLRLGKCDTSRMQSSGVPVLRSHEPDNLVGAVLRVDKTGGVWRSDWRLPKIPSNRRTFDELDSGILRGISVGGNLVWSTLTIDNEDEANWGDPDSILFSADWMLIEESLTAIPADVRATVDREATAVLHRNPAIFDTLITPTGIMTAETPALMQRLESLVLQHNQSVSVRRETMTTPQATENLTIPKELIERAIAEQLQRSEALKALTDLPAEVARLSEAIDADAQRNMEYRAKLDRLQFQPGGQVLQQGNWTPDQPIIDLGKVLRLTRTEDGIFPDLNPSTTTLEESVIERAELGRPGRNVLGRIPWAALEERERQLRLQRSAMADGAGLRPLETDVLGNGGLVLAAWSPILARMETRMGVTGAQKTPWATAQMTAAGGAEGSDIPVTNLTVNNVEYLPVSIASAYEITTSLRGVDDDTFEAIASMAISDVLLEQVTSQVLVGGAANQIAGLWGTAGVANVDYGAAATNFERNDVLDWFDHVRLSKTDGGMYTAVAGDGLWQLMERAGRGFSGDAAAGYTNIPQFVMETTGPHMGMAEGEMVFHYADLAPSGVTNAGLFFKADRVLVWFWGDSLTLEHVPQVARKDVWKMCAEANMVAYRPAENVSRIKQG